MTRDIVIKSAARHLQDEIRKFQEILNKEENMDNRTRAMRLANLHAVALNEYLEDLQ